MYLSCRWKNQINYYSFQMIRHETTKLLDYLPTNPYDWQWRTCSDGHIAPAQKPNRSITCNSHSTRLPVWFPDRQSCPFIQYYCASHTCPFRLLSQKLQTYPSVNVWKIYTEPWASRMPVHSCDSHKTTHLSTHAFSCFSSWLTANMSAQLWLSLPTNS